MTCPHIVSSREGTQYCDLAEQAVRERETEIARLRKRDTHLLPDPSDEREVFCQCKSCVRAKYDEAANLKAASDRLKADRDRLAAENERLQERLSLEALDAATCREIEMPKIKADRDRLAKNNEQLKAQVLKLSKEIRDCQLKRHADRGQLGKANDLLFVSERERNKIAAENERLRLSQALSDVRDERQRQVEVEGWTAEHDDEHDDGALPKAAACYALRAALGEHVIKAGPGPYWPWNLDWWKPKNPRHDLVRAAALIIAEIERIDRAALGEGE